MDKKRKNEWLEWLKAMMLAVIIALLIQNFVFATSIVKGDSMEPTLRDGNRLIFNKIIYMIDEPKRGDIIIIQQTDKNYVKRVIGLPGESIEIRNSELYIDGVRYIETFLSEEFSRKTGDFGPITVPADNYFVMGDNRAISNDSRSDLGFIHRDEIIGKSELIIYPFSEWGRTK